VADEGLIDLQLVDRQSLEIAQGRISRAEIVDGDFDPKFAQFADCLSNQFGIIN
jgi:hypothetical protein